MFSRLSKILDKIIEIGLLVIIGLTPIYFNVKTFSIFEINRLVLFQVLTEIVLFCFIVKVVLEKKVEINVRPKSLILAGLFVFILGLTSIFSLSPHLSLWGSYVRKMGWIYWLHCFIFFFIFISWFKSEKFRRVILVILFSAAIVSGYGIAQRLGFDAFSWGEPALLTGRIFSTFGQPNFLASWLLFIIPIAIYSLFLFKKFLSRFFIILLIGLALLALLFTFSRGAWLGALVGGLFFLVVYSLIKEKKKIFLTGAIIVILILSLGIFVNLLDSTCQASRAGLFDILPKTDSAIWLRMRSLATFSGPTSILRIKFWQDGLDIIKKRPILGYGLETQRFNFIRYYQPDWAIYTKINSCPDRAHNEFLDLLLTSGILGLASFLVLLGYIFWQGLKRATKGSIFLLSGLVGYFISNQFSFPTIVNGLYFWLFLGLILSEPGTESWRINLKPAVRKFVIIGLAMVVAMSIWYLNIRMVVADWHFRQAQISESSKNWQEVIKDYEMVLKFNPDEPYYRQALATVLMKSVEKAAAREEQKKILDFASENIERVPFKDKDFICLSRRARIFTLYGNYIDANYFQKAEEVYKRLIELSPERARSYADFAEMHAMENELHRAVELYYQAISLYPPLDHPDINSQHRGEIIGEKVFVLDRLAQVFFRLTNYQRAIEAYQEILQLQPRNAVVHKRLADIYLIQGDLDKAIEENLRGLALNPSDSQWHFGAALLYMEKGRFDKAKEYARMALKLAPDDKNIQEFLTNLE